MAQQTHMLSIIGLLFALTGAAEAQTRVYLTSPITLWVSPSGSGNACTQVSPCPLTTAVFVACTAYDYGTTAGPKLKLMPGTHIAPNIQQSCTVPGMGIYTGLPGNGNFLSGIVFDIVGDDVSPPGAGEQRFSYTIACQPTCFNVSGNAILSLRGLVMMGSAGSGMCGGMAVQALTGGRAIVYDVTFTRFECVGQLFGADGGLIVLGNGDEQRFVDISTSGSEVFTGSAYGHIRIMYRTFFYFGTPSIRFEHWAAGEGGFLVDKLASDPSNSNITFAGPGLASAGVSVAPWSCAYQMYIYPQITTFPNVLNKPGINHLSNCGQ